MTSRLPCGGRWCGGWPGSSACATSHPAFRGEFTVEGGSGDELVLAWRAAKAHAELHVRLAEPSFRIRSTPPR
jgi:hypothetical protein